MSGSALFETQRSSILSFHAANTRYIRTLEDAHAQRRYSLRELELRTAARQQELAKLTREVEVIKRRLDNTLRSMALFDCELDESILTVSPTNALPDGNALEEMRKLVPLSRDAVNRVDRRVWDLNRMRLSWSIWHRVLSLLGLFDIRKREQEVVSDIQTDLSELLLLLDQLERLPDVASNQIAHQNEAALLDANEVFGEALMAAETRHRTALQEVRSAIAAVVGSAGISALDWTTDGWGAWAPSSSRTTPWVVRLGNMRATYRPDRRDESVGEAPSL